MSLGEIKCLDLGYVALDDVMGTGRTPAQKARTSFKNKTERTPAEDARLTDYLVRNKHTTPLEFCQVRFYMKMPIIVARQLVRHRSASINEISLRYVTASREFYVPELDRMNGKPTNNKQGSSSELVKHPEICQDLIRRICECSFDAYDLLLNEGLAPEVARIVLPLGTYTEWYFQQDLHNFLHLLALRLDDHAQKETQVYARAMLDLVRPFLPEPIAAWEKYRASSTQNP